MLLRQLLVLYLNEMSKRLVNDVELERFCPYVVFAAADPVLRANDKTKTVGTMELRRPAASLQFA